MKGARISTLQKGNAVPIMSGIQYWRSPSLRYFRQTVYYRRTPTLPAFRNMAFTAVGGKMQMQTQTQRNLVDMEEYSTSLVESVNNALDKIIIPVSATRPMEMEKAMRYSLMGGGKRLRPLLCIAACEVVGESMEEAMPVACALEMIHTASLIVDDLPCMDDDSLRRGRPSTHLVFGESVAIHASDALLGLALHHIAQACKGVHAADRALKIVCEFMKAVGSTGMVGGQYMDLVSAGSPSVDPSLLEYIHLHKSALMAEICLVGGGIIGGGSDAEVERLRGYGRNVGLAYQIVDDMLDEISTTQVLGKTAGKDKRSDKATYPKVYGMDKCKEMVLELTWKGQKCLSHFDQRKAAPLLSFARILVTRNF